MRPRGPVWRITLLLGLGLMPGAAAAMPQPATNQPAASTAQQLELELPAMLDRSGRQALRQRLQAIERRPDFALAQPVGQGPAASLSQALLAWAAARAKEPDGGEQAQFENLVARLASWPDAIRLRRKAEQAMPPGGDAQARIDWFAAYPPVTGLGRIRLGEALMALGRDEEAIAALRAGWRRAWIDGAEEQRLLTAYRPLLRAEDHWARFQFLFEWGGYSAARRMLDLLGPDRRRLAQARLALRGFAADVDARVAQVPAALRNDPGLVLDRAFWRRQKNLRDSARAMLTTDVDPMALERPEQWWREHHLHARTLLRQRQPQAAYDMASSHRLRPLPEADPRADRVAVAYAEAEWLAGWIALRFLDRPVQAQAHFTALYDAVSTPVSRSRAAYWLGRAALALNQSEQAQEWFGRAARHPQRYYGQLAAEYLGATVALPAPPALVLTNAKRDHFLEREDVRAALMLHEIDADQLLARFVRHIAARAQTPSEQALAAALGRAINRPDLPLHVAKSNEDGRPDAIAYGYPTIDLPQSLAKRPSLAHAIIRQESAFDHHAVSAAGARGLMQLMPATARSAARKAGKPFALERLTGDPAYNMTLAGNHVAKLDRDYAGALVLMVAAYNAGENAVNRWIGHFGDPREGATDVIDWVELIPYGETRNYVQRVLEAATVYAAQFGDLGPQPTLSQLLGQSKAAKSGS